jgi:uncharacterized membrane protein YkvA (DUF1232 family)
MPLSITFELDDNDIEHFISMAQEAQQAVNGAGIGPDEIVDRVRALFSGAQRDELPEFIATRLQKLETLVDMVDDDEWQLPGDDRDRVLKAMAYFANPEDLIPDRVPRIGFLDDAIMVELVLETLEHEIGSYEEFCQFRSAETKRRQNEGRDPHVGREDWLADKRAVLHSLMRKRRADMADSPISRIRLF